MDQNCIDVFMMGKCVVRCIVAKAGIRPRICDMIKRIESDVEDIVLEILTKTVFNWFFSWFFLSALTNSS